MSFDVAGLQQALERQARTAKQIARIDKQRFLRTIEDLLDGVTEQLRTDLVNEIEAAWEESSRILGERGEYETHVARRELRRTAMDFARHDLIDALYDARWFQQEESGREHSAEMQKELDHLHREEQGDDDRAPDELAADIARGAADLEHARAEDRTTEEIYRERLVRAVQGYVQFRLRSA